MNTEDYFDRLQKMAERERRRREEMRDDSSSFKSRDLF